MAIAALSMDGDPSDRSAAVRRARAIGIAVRFATGHALLLAIGAGLLVLIGWSLPVTVERGGEMLGGALLVVMGLVTLQHLFVHRDQRDPPSPPRRFGAADASHSHLPTMIG